MRPIALGLLVGSLAAATAGCASSARRPPYDPSAPRYSRWVSGPRGRTEPPLLVARAWAGREPPTTLRAQAVIAFARRQVGKPYCWGGSGPRCFDCSGLVQSAWASVGVSLPRTADAMARRLDEVAIEDVRSGDVLWWPGHVGLYAGEGWIIEALDARDGVVRRGAKNPYRALRPRDEAARLP